MKQKLVWLASYPKSGNTWMRMFLAAYHKPLGEDLRLQEAFGTTISDSKRQIYENVAGRNNLSDREVDQLREAVQIEMAARVQPPVLVKTHNARIRHNGFPLIRRELTLGAIYILRNPLDVVDSVADHWGCSIDHAVQIMAMANHTIGGSQERMVRQYLQSWSMHVLSWTERPAFPTLIVRYEDMLHAPEMAFRNVITFLGWKVDPERIKNAIDQTQFDKLQAKESESGFKERSVKSLSGRFFRQGKSGMWEHVLSESQIEKILKDQGDAMKRFGYSDGKCRRLIGSSS